jgi:hypothetical protein
MLSSLRVRKFVSAHAHDAHAVDKFSLLHNHQYDLPRTVAGRAFSFSSLFSLRVMRFVARSLAIESFFFQSLQRVDDCSAAFVSYVFLWYCITSVRPRKVCFS